MCLCRGREILLHNGKKAYWRWEKESKRARAKVACFIIIILFYFFIFRFKLYVRSLFVGVHSQKLNWEVRENITANAPIHFHFFLLFFQNVLIYFNAIFLSNENKNSHSFFFVMNPYTCSFRMNVPTLPLILAIAMLFFFYLMHFSIVKVIMISSFNWIKTFVCMSIFYPQKCSNHQ